MELSLTPLSSAEQLLKSFNEKRERSLKQAERVLFYLAEADLINSFQKHRKRKFDQAERVIINFKKGYLDYFDIFRKVGFVADENSLSDAIAALLDPRERHKLGINPLLLVLEKLAGYDAVKIERLKKLIRKNKSHIVVHRERHEGNTIPDIEIVGSNFLIFIENKLRGGSETFIHESWQTNRQWEALLNRSYILNISEENLVAIYLTPEGKLPKNKNFIPLSVPELISALQLAVAKAQNDDLKCSLFAFLNFYSWE